MLNKIIETFKRQKCKCIFDVQVWELKNGEIAAQICYVIHDIKQPELRTWEDVYYTDDFRTTNRAEWTKYCNEVGFALDSLVGTENYSFESKMEIHEVLPEVKEMLKKFEENYLSCLTL